MKILRWIAELMVLLLIFSSSFGANMEVIAELAQPMLTAEVAAEIENIATTVEPSEESLEKGAVSEEAISLVEENPILVANPTKLIYVQELAQKNEEANFTATSLGLGKLFHFYSNIFYEEGMLYYDADMGLQVLGQNDSQVLGKQNLHKEAENFFQSIRDGKFLQELQSVQSDLIYVAYNLNENNKIGKKYSFADSLQEIAPSFRKIYLVNIQNSRKKASYTEALPSNVKLLELSDWKPETIQWLSEQLFETKSANVNFGEFPDRAGFHLTWEQNNKNLSQRLLTIKHALPYKASVKVLRNGAELTDGYKHCALDGYTLLLFPKINTGKYELEFSYEGANDKSNAEESPSIVEMRDWGVTGNWKLETERAEFYSNLTKDLEFSIEKIPYLASLENVKFQAYTINSETQSRTSFSLQKQEDGRYLAKDVVFTGIGENVLYIESMVRGLLHVEDFTQTFDVKNHAPQKTNELEANYEILVDDFLKPEKKIAILNLGEYFADANQKKLNYLFKIGESEWLESQSLPYFDLRREGDVLYLVPSIEQVQGQSVSFHVKAKDVHGAQSEEQSTLLQVKPLSESLKAVRLVMGTDKQDFFVNDEILTTFHIEGIEDFEKAGRLADLVSSIEILENGKALFYDVDSKLFTHSLVATAPGEEHLQFSAQLRGVHLLEGANAFGELVRKFKIHDNATNLGREEKEIRDKVYIGQPFKPSSSSYDYLLTNKELNFIDPDAKEITILLEKENPNVQLSIAGNSVQRAFSKTILDSNLLEIKFLKGGKYTLIFTAEDENNTLSEDDLTVELEVVDRYFQSLLYTGIGTLLLLLLALGIYLLLPSFMETKIEIQGKTVDLHPYNKKSIELRNILFAMSYLEAYKYDKKYKLLPQKKFACKGKNIEFVDAAGKVTQFAQYDTLYQMRVGSRTIDDVQFKNG